MKKIYGWVIGLMMVSLTAQAKLNIEITQGMAAGIPIAVQSSKQEIATGYTFEDLANVIRQDLRMCGRFSPLLAEQTPRLSVNEETLVSPWQARKVENVVLGTIQSEGGGRYSVTYKLLDIYKVQQEESMGTSANQATQLSARTYHGVLPADFRRLAHQISDEVYEKLTGIRGAFSTRIAYVMVVPSYNGKQYSLEIADADGFNPINLVKSKEPIMSPSWSPDGKSLTFVSFEKNRSEVYLINIATGKRQLLSDLPGINGAPAWSPDGQKLALVLSKEETPKIYVMDLASKQMTQVTQGLSIDTEPAWSADGSKLYFTSNRGGKPQIYRMDLATNRTERVTFVGSYNARPMLTPDGKYLVMMHREERSDPFHIASQDLTTGQVSVLTNARLDESPTLSPNGAMVLYGTQDGSRQVLGLITIDGRGQLRLPAREGNVQEPAWSPFLS